MRCFEGMLPLPRDRVRPRLQRRKAQLPRAVEESWTKWLMIHRHDLAAPSDEWIGSHRFPVRTPGTRIDQDAGTDRAGVAHAFGLRRRPVVDRPQQTKTY